MDTDLFAAKEHKERKDSSLSAPFGERAWGEVSFSNFHVAAALLQLITDLLDELVGKLRRFLGNVTGDLFAAQNLHV